MYRIIESKVQSEKAYMTKIFDCNKKKKKKQLIIELKENGQKFSVISRMLKYQNLQNKSNLKRKMEYIRSTKAI